MYLQPLSKLLNVGMTFVSTRFCRIVAPAATVTQHCHVGLFGHSGNNFNVATVQCCVFMLYFCAGTRTNGTKSQVCQQVVITVVKCLYAAVVWMMSFHFHFQTYCISNKNAL